MAGIIWDISNVRTTNQGWEKEGT